MNHRFLPLLSYALAMLCLITACGSRESSPQEASIPSETELQLPTEFFIPVTNLDTEAYPDNPDLGFMANDYQFTYFDSVRLKHRDTVMNLEFTSVSGENLLLEGIDLDQFIPTVPAHVKGQTYLTQVLLINQEWNRNQVRFDAGMFRSGNKRIVRVDLARNCLNSYLWELIVYVEEEGKQLPFAHAWFNFPKELYQQAFERINDFPFAQYAAYLEHWKDIDSEVIPKEVLRKEVEELSVSYTNKSDAMYPLKKARLKKLKEVIYPKQFATMRDLQSDSTLFATFSPPGFYNKADPRVTELGRIHSLENLEVLKVLSPVAGDTLYELNFSFSDHQGERETQLCLGGLSFEDLPILSEEEANDGWKNSMGFANHTFYESYAEHMSCPTSQNPYYAYLSDSDGKWLDSHKIGIDGPLMHWDDVQEGLLHVWLLSFERHALVAHYEIDLSVAKSSSAGM